MFPKAFGYLLERDEQRANKGGGRHDRHGHSVRPLAGRICVDDQRLDSLHDVRTIVRWTNTRP